MLIFIDFEEWWNWLTIARVSQFCWLLPLLAVAITGHWKRADHRRVLAFVLYTIGMEYFSTSERWNNYFSDETNAPWYHLLTPLLFFLLSRLFADYLDRGRYRFWSWGLPLLFTAFSGWNAIWGDGFYNFPTKAVGLYSFSGIVFSVGYFIYLLREMTTFYLERWPMFWVSAGLLIYFASNFLLWLGLNYLTYERSFFFSIYRINSYITIFLTICFTIAICLTPKNDEPVNALTS